MTTTQDPIAHAARLLRETAEELRQAHAYNNSEGWENETDAKAAYDEHLAAAQALEDWEAAIGAGGMQAQLAPAAAAGPSLQHLHDLLYTAQRTTGDAQAQAIAEARIALSGIMTAQEPAVLASRAWPKVSGVSRDEGHSRALLVFFAAEPTDDEMRAVHDTLAAAPTAQAAPQPAPATQQAGDVVAYLDVGAGGYLDLGSELSEDALQQLPKGRHALVIAGTYGIDGYVAAPQPSPTTKPAPQQEAQEPCPTCVALARTVMLDQVSFDRKPDCYGIRQITDDESVEEWEDIRTSPDVAREEANDMMATGRGEIYEVVPLYAAPQPAPAPVSDEVVRDAAFEAVRKKLCTLPRYSFVLDDDGLVRRAPDRTGNWIEFDEAHALFDPVSVEAALAAQGGE